MAKLEKPKHRSRSDGKLLEIKMDNIVEFGENCSFLTHNAFVSSGVESGREVDLHDTCRGCSRLDEVAMACQ